MNHKRGKRKNARAGCLMCKPNKMNGFKQGINSFGHYGFGKIRQEYHFSFDMKRYDVE